MRSDAAHAAVLALDAPVTAIALRLVDRDQGRAPGFGGNGIGSNQECGSAAERSTMSDTLKSPRTAERKDLSPRIAALAWGKLEVEGVGTFRDAKVFPGGAREWDWSETGTDHEPGIQPADVDELLRHGATSIVLSQGMNGRLHVCAETLRLLAEHGVMTHVLPTAEAVELYNRLRERQPVAGLFHTTC
jgi:hypothetical protein